LVQDKKINEAASLIREIKNFNFAITSYDTKIEIDKVFNYLLEQLNSRLIVGLHFIIMILKTFGLKNKI
jgi:hypothetical protein